MIYFKIYFYPLVHFDFTLRKFSRSATALSDSEKSRPSMIDMLVVTLGVSAMDDVLRSCKIFSAYDGANVFI